MNPLRGLKLDLKDNLDEQLYQKMFAVSNREAIKRGLIPDTEDLDELSFQKHFALGAVISAALSPSILRNYFTGFLKQMGRGDSGRLEDSSLVAAMQFLYESLDQIPNLLLFLASEEAGPEFCGDCEACEKLIAWRNTREGRQTDERIQAPPRPTHVRVRNSRPDH